VVKPTNRIDCGRLRAALGVALALLLACSGSVSDTQPGDQPGPTASPPAMTTSGVQTGPGTVPTNVPQASGMQAPGTGAQPPAGTAVDPNAPGMMAMNEPMGGPTPAPTEPAPPAELEEDPPAVDPDPTPPDPVDPDPPDPVDPDPPDPVEPDPDPGTPAPNRPMVGVYVGNDAAGVGRFESWLGHPVDAVLGYTGNASWEDYDGSVGWAVGLWKDVDRRILWSVPLIPTGATLEAAAAGEYDAHYKKAAQTLAAYRPQDAELFVRTGWEFNGNWFPWAAKGKGAAFAGAFRRFVAQFRSVSDRFVLDWNANVGDVGMNPEEGYPGDDYVDIISLDFYWNTQWDPADPVAAWDSMMNRMWGLKWHADFAKAHGKRMAYAEWGVMSNNAGPYIERARAWFAQHNVVYHTYWDSNLDFKGKLSANQYPQAGSAYRTAFPAP
jgi:hypothetical protein